MHDPQTELSQRFSAAIAEAFGPEHAAVDPLIAPAKNPKFGDYQANVAMSLGKAVGRNPRDVAADLLAALDVGDLFDPPDIAGPGFINLRLKDDYLSQCAASLAGDERLGVGPDDSPQRVVVDYSGPNVAKEMHVGHIRSTIIGDAIVRVLEFLGHTTIRRNHLGDWGTQFGMLIEHMIDTGATTQADSFHVGDLNALYQQSKQAFDSDPAFADRARDRVVKLQSGDPDTLKLWRLLIDESYRHFSEVYARLNVRLTEDDVRGESAYNDVLSDVLADLESAGLTVLSDGAVCVFPDGFAGRDGEPLPLIIRKSDGGFLYATTDLAALRYRIRDEHAQRIAYVTDARQKQHFAMVFQTAKSAGWIDEGAAQDSSGGVRLDHVPFGTILGEDGTPFKTRSGDTVKLADLLDEAEQRAAAIVARKNPDLDANQRRQVARVVAIGAIKYADLSSDRVKDYVFSWDRMLAMDGNTAPYLQYAYARIQSIFAKADVDPSTLRNSPAPTDVPVTHPAEKALILKILQLGGVIRAVSETLEPHRLCTYLYELASSFSSFYENCPVIAADNDAQRRARLILCDITARTLKTCLGLLGIETLDRM
ncbi:MAG: arginine--tRNA ligase [Planctomycetaceae bacterium]|nr:arginine--tRNA ligase [Planctomycetaceae bacterium]